MHWISRCKFVEESIIFSLIFSLWCSSWRIFVWKFNCVTPRQSTGFLGSTEQLGWISSDGKKLFHNYFSSSTEQWAAEQRILAHKSEQPTAGCIAIFHKYVCYIKQGGIITNLNLWNPRGYVTDMSQCRCVEHGLEYITFYVQPYLILMLPSHAAH